MAWKVAYGSAPTVSRTGFVNVALEVVTFGAVLQALVATRAAIDKSLNMLIGCQR